MMDTETASSQWNSTLDPASLLHDFSPQAAEEVRAVLGTHPVFEGMTNPQAIEAITFEPEALPSFISNIHALREKVRHGHHFVVA
ncbi:MAG: hypothetical protein QF600_07005, partial [Verrucomicrobiota bacterium]|nr:hypothetical protein [Verrucomicrobiota bacterium]